MAGNEGMFGIAGIDGGRDVGFVIDAGGFGGYRVLLVLLKLGHTNSDLYQSGNYSRNRGMRTITFFIHLVGKSKMLTQRKGRNKYKRTITSTSISPSASASSVCGLTRRAAALF